MLCNRSSLPLSMLKPKVSSGINMEVIKSNSSIDNTLSDGAVKPSLKKIIEAVILSSNIPLSLDKLQSVFEGEQVPAKVELKQAIAELESDYQGRGFEIVEVSSGYRIQVKHEMQSWVSKLWEEKPAKYSRAFLETLSIIAYRQPITRGEIEDIRGVSINSAIMKTLMERNWIRVVGRRDVPGHPSLYGTTKDFLNYFNLKSLDDLPSLMELRDITEINAELDLQFPSGDSDEPAKDDEQENHEQLQVVQNTTIKDQN